jgi:hypothetical protein
MVWIMGENCADKTSLVDGFVSTPIKLYTSSPYGFLSIGDGPSRRDLMLTTVEVSMECIIWFMEFHAYISSAKSAFSGGGRVTL